MVPGQVDDQEAEEADADQDHDGDGHHGDDEPEDDARAATMAGRTARSLTDATTESTVSRALAVHWSLKLCSGTGRDYSPAPPGPAATM